MFMIQRVVMRILEPQDEDTLALSQIHAAEKLQSSVKLISTLLVSENSCLHI